MWPGDPLLLVVIGSNRIDAGIWQRQAWQAGSQCHVEIGQAGGLTGLGPALAQLAAQIKAQRVEVTPVPKRRGAAARCPLRILLADGWYASAIVPWNPNDASGKALIAHARASLLGSGFDLRAEDTVRVADAAYCQARWTVAYQADMLHILDEFAVAAAVNLESVAPLSVAALHALRETLPEQALVALMEGREIALWYVRNSYPKRLLRLETPSQTPQDAVDLLWRRARLRDLRLASLDKVFVLDLSGQATTSQFSAERHVIAELPALAANENVAAPLRVASLVRDGVFDLDARQRFPRLSFRRLAAASLALSVAVALCYQAVHLARVEAEEQQQLASRKAAFSPRPGPVWSKNEQQRIVAVNTAIRQLNLPVAPLLQAIQPPKDIRVAVLGVKFEPGRGGDEMPLLQLTAESRSGEEMARYAGFLASRPPLVDAYVTRHEVVDNDMLKPYRFVVTARWRE